MLVPEHRLRASQICRVLGSPISLSLTAMLLDRGPLPLPDLARAARRSKSDTCYHLTRLRLAQIVRYENRKGETLYWIKYPAEIRRLLRSLGTFVGRAGRRLGET